MRAICTALLAVLTSCTEESPGRKDPLIAFDAIDVAAWRAACGAEVSIETGPRRMFAERDGYDPKVHMHHHFTEVEVVRWQCQTPDGIRVVLDAEPQTKLIDHVSLITASTNPTTLAEASPRFLIPLTRPEYQAPVRRFLARAKHTLEWDEINEELTLEAALFERNELLENRISVYRSRWVRLGREFSDR